MKTIEFRRLQWMVAGAPALTLTGKPFWKHSKKRELKTEDSALLWFVDIRFSGNQLPDATDTTPRNSCENRPGSSKTGVREVAGMNCGRALIFRPQFFLGRCGKWWSPPKSVVRQYAR